jgi:uncharacterized Fe-S center protein
MSKVYFSKNIEPILEIMDISGLGQNVAIKLHFGEKGCTTFLDPNIAEKVYDKIVKAGKKATLVECNVLYKGSRTNSADHIRTAREHGFNLPIDILDGENGEEYTEVDGCKVGLGIKKYDSMVVLSHFKGHEATGFGAAIKNIGMGLGSRAGKLAMHSSVKPSIADNCVGCGICALHCNANAIILLDHKARIDQEKCEGCAICISFCPNHAVSIPWQGRTSAEVQLKIAEYAAAVLKIIPNSIYINVLTNITKNCDCLSFTQEPIMPDIGFLYSDDLVAIEKASLDLADKHSNKKFSNIHEADNSQQLEYALKLNLGSDVYELINL